MKKTKKNVYGKKAFAACYKKAEKIFPWRDPKDETAHIQAKTIKSKLKSVIRLTNFLTDRNIFIGLTRRDISDLTLFIGTLQKT